MTFAVSAVSLAALRPVGILRNEAAGRVPARARRRLGGVPLEDLALGRRPPHRILERVRACLVLRPRPRRCPPVARRRGELGDDRGGLRVRDDRRQLGRAPLASAAASVRRLRSRGPGSTATRAARRAGPRRCDRRGGRASAAPRRASSARSGRRQLQQRIPAESIARVVSAYGSLGSLVLAPLGFALVGPLAGWVGIDTMLWFGAAWIVAATTVVLSVPSIRQLRATDPARPERPKGRAPRRAPACASRTRARRCPLRSWDRADAPARRGSSRRAYPSGSRYVTPTMSAGSASTLYGPTARLPRATAAGVRRSSSGPL